MALFEARNRPPRMVTENKEDIRLIYLCCDNDEIEDAEEMMMKLKAINPAAEFYTKLNLCLKLIQSIQDERLFLIVSGFFDAEILSKIGAIPTVVAIFVLSITNQCRISKTGNKKIVDIFTDPEVLIKSVLSTMRLVQNNRLAFSLFDQKQTSIRDLTNESISFLWYQLLIHVLKQIPNDQESKQEMLAICYEYYHDNNKELENIKEFEDTYTPEMAIYWYTTDCFLYKLLNRALRTEDILLLYMFRFFVIDLCNEIEEESRNATASDIMMLYRGQVMPNDDINKLKDNVGILMSFNGFVSTTRSKKIALKFVSHNYLSDDFQCVLFEIEVDRRLTTAGFADVAHKSSFEGEQEVLFTLNACFQLVSIDFDSHRSLWNVRLKATDEGSNKFQEYLKLIEEQMSEHTPLIYYGRLVLYEFGRVDQAKDYFNTLKKLLPANHPALVSVYDHLGHVHNQRDELNLALKYYQRAYRIHEKKLPSHHPYIARSLNHLGTIYERKGYLQTALKYYREASLIQNQHSPDGHLQKALVLESIGIAYRAKHDLDMALNSLSRALDSYQCVMFPPHYQIAQCLGYIGLVYEDKNELKMALDYYQQQLKMEEEHLPPDHWHLYAHISWIVHVQMRMDQRDEAWKFCQEKYEDAKRRLGATHQHVARMRMIMAELVEDDDRNQALFLYEEALSILNASTKPDDRLLSQCLLAIANLYNKHNMLHDALQYDKKALMCVRQCLPSDHIDLAFTLKNLGISFRAVNNVTEANNCFSESLSIYRANYAPKHAALKLYSRVITELVEQRLETSSSEPQQQQHSSNSTNQKDELTSPQQSSRFDQSISTSTSEAVKRTTRICVIL